MPLLASKYATAASRPPPIFRGHARSTGATLKATAPAFTPGAEYTPANGAPVTKESIRAIKLTWMNEDVVQPSLQSWVTSHLKEADEPVAITGNLEEVVGYNWKFDDWRSSYAPGKPPKFIPPEKLPESIPRNSGTHYVNQDAHLEPLYPFKPMFSALENTKPNYSLEDVDIVADSATLLTLLGFIDGETEEDIRIELHLVESTLILTNREQHTSIDIDPKRGSSRPYEHSFPKHCAKFDEDQGGAHTHHRAVRYTFGGLSCIVKSIPHAYCEGGDYVTEGTGSDAADKFSAEALQAEKEARIRRIMGLDKLSEVTVQADVAFGKESSAKSAEIKIEIPAVELSAQERIDVLTTVAELAATSPITFTFPESDTASVNSLESSESTESAESHKTGTLSRNVSNGSASTASSKTSIRRIQTPCYAELTARFEGNKFKEEPIDTPYHFPRMYFARIPTIIVGTYRDGLFSSIQAFSAKHMLTEWETERQDDLRKLVQLLGDWKKVTKQAGGKAVAICDAQFWPLKFNVYKMDSPRGVLEESVVKKFWKVAPVAEAVVAEAVVAEETKADGVVAKD